MLSLLGTHTPRMLYNSTFIAAGCPEGEYDPNFAIDDLPWTYATNFAITLVGIAAFCKLGSYGCGIISSYSKKIDPTLPYFFLMTGIAFFVGGIIHAAVKRTSQEPLYTILFVITTIFNGIATVFLALYGLALVQIRRSSPETWKRGIWWSTLVLYLAIGVYSAAVVRYFYSGIALGVACIVNTILYVVTRTKLYIPKAFSLLTVTASLLTQNLLHSRCSFHAYSSCFEECPLPNAFNHNALFHTMYFIGIGILFICEDCHPSAVCGEIKSGDENSGPAKPEEDENLSV